MEIRSTLNGGHAEVDDSYAERLIASGAWEAVTAAPKPVRKARAKKAPVEEPKSEE